MIAARLPFVAVALVCAVLGAYLTVRSGTEARLGRANSDVLAGRDAEALTELGDLSGEAGRRAQALRGYAHLGTGDLTRSRSEFQDAVQRDPNSWVLQRDYAIVLLRLGERTNAQARMRRARQLNPRMPLPPGFSEAS